MSTFSLSNCHHIQRLQHGSEWHGRRLKTGRYALFYLSSNVAVRNYHRSLHYLYVLHILYIVLDTLNALSCRTWQVYCGVSRLAASSLLVCLLHSFPLVSRASSETSMRKNWRSGTTAPLKYLSVEGCS